jgi:GGDEF domain-containing protein
MTCVKLLDAAAPGRTLTPDERISTQLGQVLGKGLRAGDLLGARQTGQFMLVLPGATPSAARMVAERLCALVQDAQLRDQAGHLLSLQMVVVVGGMPADAPLTQAWPRLATALSALSLDRRCRVLLLDPSWLD